ncbi:phage head closure protein [Rhizobium beringeri]|uniref:phage head closure protein n=1 Tax=Rhizobium TaxID=379 RepID=UPI00139410C4|nr:phage head closure protein [Rhizobium leguminosarum]MVO95085.1 phage head closure protein [Rhizobium leguminosarum bv. phaseoli]
MCKCGSDFSSSANTRIVVQSPTETSDEFGGRAVTWNDLVSLWAVVEPMAGREIYVSAQQQSRVDARILIRYRSDLSDTTTAARNRVKVDNRLYNIAAVKNLADDLKTEGKDFQQLLCMEGQPA